ncbi:MAG: hypothetical protein WC881_01540 [Elusimicrobiota bacterium]|jgi:hypothetical protein
MNHAILAWSAGVGLLAAAGCSGTVPGQRGRPEQGVSAIIVGGRFTVPTGETLSGELSVNLDGEGAYADASYRIPIRPHQSLLYQVEPGTYRIAPTRDIFGTHQPLLRIKIEGRDYRVPFPRDILRKAALELKPKKILTVGTFAVELQPALPGRPPIVTLRLDDSIATRRQLVQDVIREMMDPGAPPAGQENAIAWARALQSTLMELASETGRGALYKSAP